MRLARACVLLAACGRFDFDALPRRADAAADVRVADIPGDGANLCLPSYRVCDGFEGPLAPIWTADLGTTIDNTVAHRGASSVHFQSPALSIGMQGYYRVSNTTVLPVGDSPSFGDFLFVKAGAFLVYEQFDDLSNNAPTAPPLNTWICALWTTVRDSGTAGSITLDGDLGTAAISSVTTDGTPPVSVFSFGIGYSATNVNVAQPAMEMWMDDLIVAPAPLTCFD